MMLEYKAPTPGTGWGCRECGLEQDGALAVLCDDCIEKRAPIRWACLGDPARLGRVEVEQLTGLHQCDLSKHPEAQALGYMN